MKSRGKTKKKKIEMTKRVSWQEKIRSLSATLKVSES